MEDIDINFCSFFSTLENVESHALARQFGDGLIGLTAKGFLGAAGHGVDLLRFTTGFCRASSRLVLVRRPVCAFRR